MKDERVVFLKDHEIPTAGGRLVYRAGEYHQLEGERAKELAAAGVVETAATHEKRAAAPAKAAEPVMHAATARGQAPAAKAPEGKMWPATNQPVLQDTPHDDATAAAPGTPAKGTSVRPAPRGDGVQTSAGGQEE